MLKIIAFVLIVWFVVGFLEAIFPTDRRSN